MTPSSFEYFRPRSLIEAVITPVSLRMCVESDYQMVRWTHWDVACEVKAYVKVLNFDDVH